jgi:hypothetical protein
LVPALDRLAHRSLRKSRSPYLGEIAAIADALQFPGVWMLNVSYQWGCTARACQENGEPWLIRTLDWPFRGLGRHAEIARMRGFRGSDYFSVTWPGYIGVLTAMAPGRLAAALNQAPMWRRTRHHWLRPFDYVTNILCASRVSHIAPDQLLRRAFDECEDFASARRLLETTPVARPAIYTLVGPAAGQGCIIERTETDFLTRFGDTCAANDWEPCRPGWEGRIGMRRFLVCSFAEAAGFSRARRESLAEWEGSLSASKFDWLREPVLNPYTRLAVAMNPARGILRVVGYDLADEVLPVPVTEICELEVLAEAA